MKYIHIFPPNSQSLLFKAASGNLNAQLNRASALVFRFTGHGKDVLNLLYEMASKLMLAAQNPKSCHFTQLSRQTENFKRRDTFFQFHQLNNM